MLWLRVKEVYPLASVLISLISLIGLMHQVLARPPKCPREDFRDKKYLDHCVKSCSKNDYNYICGKDGVTYQNQCYLDRYHCEINFAKDNPSLWIEQAVELNPNIQTMPCRNHKKNTKCPIMCPVNIEFPACDGTGKVYLNPCQLKKETCGRQGIGVYHPEFLLCQQYNIEIFPTERPFFCWPGISYHPYCWEKYPQYFAAAKYSGLEYDDY